ncbi:MAG: methyltransferase domain-containing protein [Planctomycetes bacterium]|nr:methyltransferase domain-containing protein [Planctomycetota bacterium]
MLETASLVITIAIATDLDVRPAIEEAIEEYVREAHALARAEWAAPEALAERAAEADVVVWQAAGPERPELERRIVAGSVKLVARMRRAILVRQGNPKGIRGMADLDRDGIRVARGGEALEVVEALRNDRIDAAVAWDALEGLAPCEIDAVALPEAIAPPVPIRAAVAAASAHPAEARAFIAFLASPVGQAVLGRNGYDVPLVHGDAEAYDALVERRLRPTYPMTARRALLASGIRRGVCLDLGCGTGQLDVVLARQSDLEIIGLDIDPGMIEIARARIEKEGLSKRIRFVTGDVQALPFDDRSADLVISRGSLVFWQDKAAALREVHRVLKPTGYALLGGRYLFTPPHHRISDAELERAIAAARIPRARVITDRGQWVEIRGSAWKPSAGEASAGMAMLAGRVLVDYGIARGRCLVIGNRFTGIETEIALQSELDVIAVFPTDDAVRAAEPAIREAGLERRVRVIAGDPGALSLADGSVDLVVSAGALPFWRDKAAVLRQVHRVLRPGGAAFLGGRYLGMPERRKISDEALREIVASTGIPGIRVIRDMGQWVEIRKTSAPRE